MLKALITLEARVVHPLLPNCSQGAVRRKHTEVEALAGDVPGK